MTVQDIAPSVELSAAAFGFDAGDEPARERMEQRMRHLLASDPQGSFVAELEGEVIGAAQALLRERLWCLSMLTVAPDRQSAGAGRSLLARALEYGPSDAPGLIVSSDDPRALRLYGLAGFTLLPTFAAQGSVDRASLPRPDVRVREAGAPDLEAFAAISREVRGAPHTPELALALRQGAAALRLGDRGFAMWMSGLGVWVLAARDVDAARALLWHALATMEDGPRAGARWLTGEQGWAVDALLRAGLRLRNFGALAVRGTPGPLYPYIPSGAFG